MRGSLKFTLPQTLGGLCGILLALASQSHCDVLKPQAEEALVISTVAPPPVTSTSSSTTGPTTPLPPQEDKVVTLLEANNLNVQGDAEKPESSVLKKPEIYSFKIQSDVKYRYARTYVLSRVVNPDSSRSQEVTFRVILPETAFISKFIMEIDGKAYEAYVKEKEVAKQIYNQAQSQGQSAGLVEVNTRNANVFDVNVNIKAQSKVNFNLTYEELLSRRLGYYEQSISIVPDQVSNVKDFQIGVTIEESQNITVLRVPNLRNDVDAVEDSEGNNKDAVIERPAGNKANITWRPSEKDQSQLSKQGITGKFVVQYDIKRELDAGEVLVMNGYFVHFFAPSNLKPLKKHVVFVLDTSGSMWGRRIEQLKDAMKKILADLSSDDYFNIFTFASEVTPWSPTDPIGSTTWRPQFFHGEPVVATPPPPKVQKPFPANPENIAKAQEFVGGLVASGGTNILDPIVQALNLTSAVKLARNVQTNKTQGSSSEPLVTSFLPNTTSEDEPTNTNVLPPNVESLIIFLTDGEPTVGVTNPTIIQSLIKLSNQNISVPIFSLGFGDEADFPFLRKLSLQNNGFARKIYEASDAALQLKGFYNEIASPLLSNVTFNYTSPEYTVSNVTVTKFVTIFGGTEIAVAGRLEGIPGATKNQSVPQLEGTEVPTTTTPPEAEPEPQKPQVPSYDAVVPTDVSYFDVVISGVGRDGPIAFNRPEVFSTPIPWGLPCEITPFPARPTPPTTPEDLFLERLWAYLTIQQLIAKDLASDGKENEISDEGVSVPSPPIVPSPSSSSGVTPTSFTSIPSTIPSPTVNGSLSNLTVPAKPETSKQRALRLALKYGFVTPLTSLVVVKPNSSDVANAVSADSKPQIADSIGAHGGFTSNRIASLSSASFQSSQQMILPLSLHQPAYAPGGFGPISASRPYYPSYPTLATMLPGSNVDAAYEEDESFISFSPHKPHKPHKPPTTSVPPRTTRPSRPPPSDTPDSSSVVQGNGSSLEPPKPQANKLGLKDIKWLNETVENISITSASSGEASIYVIYKNVTLIDTIIFSSSENVTEFTCSTGRTPGKCTILKDCVQPEFLDDFGLYTSKFFCPMTGPDSIKYAGVCCPNKDFAVVA